MRRRPIVVLVVLVLVAVLGACGGASPSKSASPTSSTSTAPTTTTTSTANAGTTTTQGPATTSATTAGHPQTTTPATTAPPGNCTVTSQAPPSGTISGTFITALAFAPDGRLFYTERAGTVMVFQNGRSQAFATVATVTTEPGGGYSERGLLGLAIDPNFAQNRYVYAFYSNADYAHQDVIRWTDCDGVGTNPKILVVLPSGSDCCHKGGRLAFGPDGKLYVTLGDEHDAPEAQVISDVRGKVLRYNPDGTVPTDNPFGPGDPVWVYGLRNPFGIAFSQGGQLAITMNGPSGEIAGGPATGYDTAIFSATRGSGYQWPNCYGYGHPNPGVSSCGAGLLPPDWSSEKSTVVPSGATFVDQAGPAGYAGHLVFCTYDSGMLIFTPGSPHGSVAKGPANCTLDVKEGPNHALYYSGGNAIYRLG